MKHLKPMLAAFSAALLLVSCAENPGSDIVVHKDMEKLIDEAQQTGESKQDVEALQQNDTYTADFENESLRVRVQAEAAVEVPQTDRLSILRVKQRRFTQEDCDRVRALFMGDAPVCDLTETKGIVPRARIAESIALDRRDLQEQKARYEADPEYAANILQALRDSGTADSLEEYLAQQQQHLDEFQAQYESAPVTVDYSAYPSDGKLQSNAARIAQEADENGFWHGYCKDIPDGDTLWICTEDATAMLHVQNTDNYSNVIWYTRSPLGFQDMGSYIIALRELSEIETAGTSMDTIPGETCTLSQAEAEQQAENALQALGMTDFVCCESAEMSCFAPVNVLNATNGAEESHDYARPCRVLRYCRAVNGAPVEQSSGTKQAEVTGQVNYIEKIWPAEMIEFRINDSGIIQFQWNAPLEITETVVDSAAMKPFSEVTEIFEKMMPVTAAQASADLDTKIQIDRVRLSYSRLSEKDDFDTGLIVPVWAFYGSRTVTGENYFDEHLSGSGVQLALNAIDGSVIDPGLGY